MLPYKKRYYMTHPQKLVHHYWLELKWFWQRGRRGYAESDLWSLDGYLAGWLPDAILELSGDKHRGHPVQLCPTPGECVCGETCLGEQEWGNILACMADGFIAHSEIINGAVRWNTPEYKAAEDRYKDGSQLFVKWFGALWT